MGPSLTVLPQTTRKGLLSSKAEMFKVHGNYMETVKMLPEGQLKEIAGFI